MPDAALVQRQHQRAIPVQIQANAILSMSILELQQFIETEAMENPALDVDDSARCPVCGFLAGTGVCPVCGASSERARAARDEPRSEREHLERVIGTFDCEGFDPFRTVAGVSGLRDHLRQQARMTLGGRQLRISDYIIDSLDDDGYFREPLYDTAEMFATAVPEVELVLTTVQAFDPPGIAARDLRECLLIQLRALVHTGAEDVSDPELAALAQRILTDHWEDFSRMRLKPLAARLGISQAELREACNFIRDNLNPRPASLYRQPFGGLAPRETAAVAPDVIVRRHNSTLVAEVVDCHTRHLRIEETYHRAYQSLGCRDVCLGDDDRRHVKEHVERVKCILDAIKLRRKTLGRVALELTDRQHDFLLHGPSHLKPLRQKDLAQALEVHESTICRAIAGKYCKLPSGEVVSFDVFFDAALPIRTMISQLVSRSAEPISDGEIAKRLAEQGVTIARRTVAKYREQMRLLPYQLRSA